MTVILKFKQGDTRFTLETTPIRTGAYKADDILFFIVNGNTPLTVCHNNECRKELTLDYVEERGKMCPKCSKSESTEYTRTFFFRKLISTMLGHPSDAFIQNIEQRSRGVIK